MPKLIDVKGIGPVLAKACAANGFGSVEKIAKAKDTEFSSVPGVSEARAAVIIEAAMALLETSGSTASNAGTEDKTTSKKNRVKNKKDKKDKKKKKKK